jgi:hypothetical protein
MGYYVTGRGRVTVKEGVDMDGELLTHLKTTLLDPEFLKANARGGAHPKKGDVYEDYWYSWVRNDDLRDADTLEKLVGLFIDPAENLEFDGQSIEFSYNNKIGQEELLFSLMAPYIEPSKHAVEWRGEDDTLWSWSFDGTKMEIEQGEIVYGGYIEI